MDDFGTGRSSLLYLRDPDVNGWEIGMSFVQGYLIDHPVPGDDAYRALTDRELVDEGLRR